MIIAFASSEGRAVDGHFGWSKHFYLYEVDTKNSTFLKIAKSEDEPTEEKEKLNLKIALIAEADMMYCTQIGPTASKMIQSAGIHPVRVAEDEPIESAIAQIQEMLQSEQPPMWLLRIYHKAKQRSN